MIFQYIHPSGSCTWRIKISAGVYHFVTIHSQKELPSYRAVFAEYKLILVCVFEHL